MKPVCGRERRKSRRAAEPTTKATELDPELLGCKRTGTFDLPLHDDSANAKLAEIRQRDTSGMRRAERAARPQTTKEDLDQRLVGVLRIGEHGTVPAHDLPTRKLTGELGGTGGETRTGLKARERRDRSGRDHEFIQIYCCVVQSIS